MQHWCGETGYFSGSEGGLCWIHTGHFRYVLHCLSFLLISVPRVISLMLENAVPIRTCRPNRMLCRCSKYSIVNEAEMFHTVTNLTMREKVR